MKNRYIEYKVLCCISFAYLSPGCKCYAATDNEILVEGRSMTSLAFDQSHKILYDFILPITSGIKKNLRLLLIDFAKREQKLQAIIT